MFDCDYIVRLVLRRSSHHVFGAYLCGDVGGKHARSKRVEVEQFKVAKTYRIRMWHTKYNPASCCNAPPCLVSNAGSCKLKTARQLHNRSIVLIKHGTLWSPAIIWAYRQAPYLCFCCLLSQGICSLPRGTQGETIGKHLDRSRHLSPL